MSEHTNTTTTDDREVLRVLVTPESAAAMPDPNYLSYATIKNGSTGRDVKFAQLMLYKFMPSFAYTLAFDGQFGPATERCVKEFQRLSGLTQDGICGPATWNRLGPAVNHLYSYWNKTEAIREVQRLLALGYRIPSTGVDGLWGNQTENAVRQFQRDYGLMVDGVWGKQCWGITEQGWG